MLAQYFDVDTEDVLRRILLVLNPLNNTPYITNVPETVEGTDKKPDLWGPVWIYQTTVFAQFFATSIGSFLLSLGSQHHQYDIATFAASAMVLALFTFAVPLAVWLLIQYLNLVPSYSWVQSVSLYGYSMAVWPPLVALGGLLVPTLPKTAGIAVRWTLLGLGFLVSSKFVLMNLRNVMFNSSATVDKNTATAVLIACCLAQAGLLLALYLSSSSSPLN